MQPPCAFEPLTSTCLLQMIPCRIHRLSLCRNGRAAGGGVLSITCSGSKRGGRATCSMVPLIPGEQPSGLLRICAAADFPNGISYVVDPRETSFVNPDLTIFVNRMPADEWVLVDARTWLEPHGTGVAEGALYDRRGRIGRSMQSLLVEARG